jgi:hypothetical protein
MDVRHRAGVEGATGGRLVSSHIHPWSLGTVVVHRCIRLLERLLHQSGAAVVATDGADIATALKQSIAAVRRGKRK